MYSLKGVIFSLTDVLAHRGQMDANLLAEVVRLLRFLLSRNVQPVLVSNTTWVVTIATTGEKKPYQDYLADLVGSRLPYFQGGRDMDFKQTRAAMEHVLNHFGWASSEVMYVGNTLDDVKAASNGGFPLLNAKWHGDNSPYGFEFASPKDVASFVDCCCLSLGEWFWGYSSGGLRVYSIAPLAEVSRKYPQGAIYSTDAKNAAKLDVGNIRFWGLLMAARIHLSGIGSEIDYVAPYPGHKVNSTKRELMNAVSVVSGSLRARYLVDLIVRHTDAQKSQTLRTSGGTPTAANQLGTIHLNQAPIKPGPKQQRYKSRPNFKGKTVLVVDDICTQGFSLEAARALLEAAGARVILLSWLKTPGPNDYHRIASIAPAIKKPFQPVPLPKIKHALLSNSGNVLNEKAPDELAAAYSRYSSWDWPKGI